MIFSKNEYQDRLKKVQASMQKKGIELLISQDPSNMNYLTDYDAWSFYYAQCVIVHVNADEPICFVRNQDAGGAYIKTYLKDENIIKYDEKYIHTWPLHPYDALVDLIKERNWDKLSVGLEMDSHYFTAYCYEKIKSGLPNAKILDCERLVNWVRVVKSDAEINLMKAASKIVQNGMKKAFEVISPGVRQCDAVSEIYSSLIKGTPDQLKIDTMKKTNEALQAGIDAVKAGNTANDVAQAFWKILDKYGIEKTSRTGYSIGIGYPPDWGEHTLNISKGDMTELKPNVTFHMIAVMQFGNWGVEASEAIRVTETGSELFCNLSKDLHIKN